MLSYTIAMTEEPDINATATPSDAAASSERNFPNEAIPSPNGRRRAEGPNISAVPTQPVRGTSETQHHVVEVLSLHGLLRLKYHSCKGEAAVRTLLSPSVWIVSFLRLWYFSVDSSPAQHGPGLYRMVQDWQSRC